MPFKSRTESTELQILGALNKRMNLFEKDKQHYLNLQKGYEGEVMFDKLTEELTCECLILNDLLLKKSNTFFQIDTLLIFSDSLHLFEVKNFEGDYYYDSDRIYNKQKSEITNPLNQLNRTESLLRQLLQSIGFSIPIDASIVFINPEFTLYQTPLNKPFIFPTQINRYLKHLDKNSSKLKEKHRILANKLVSLHISDSPFKQLPAYDYDQLRKGITCVSCNSFSISVKGQRCICLDCGYEERVSNAVMRNAKEFQLLFPDHKITTTAMHDWCKVVPSKKRVGRILGGNLKMASVHRWSYYE